MGGSLPYIANGNSCAGFLRQPSRFIGSSARQWRCIVSRLKASQKAGRSKGAETLRLTTVELCVRDGSPVLKFSDERRWQIVGLDTQHRTASNVDDLSR